jgi:predicted nucleotidyltransferase
MAEMMNALPSALAPKKRELVQAAVDALRSVRGVRALVLGGSYARGTDRADSDLDLGVYYSEAVPFSVEDIRQIAKRLSGNENFVVTDFYEWGPWVNGGAWIPADVCKLDLLYRNIEHVERTIAQAAQGVTHHDYDQQPMSGFYSVIYLAETDVCLPLYDPSGIIAQIKAKVVSYPPQLKQSITAESLWGAEFALSFARKFAAAGDIYNTVGCLSRIAAHLTQVLYALNETYFISDKGALHAIASFPIFPADYPRTIARVLGQPGTTQETLLRSVGLLKTAWRQVVTLSADYQPKYRFDGVSLPN